MSEPFAEMIDNQLEELIAIRRDLHAHPQLAYEETYASQAVQRFLEQIGVPFEAGVAETGVVGWIVPPGDRGQRAAVALRADMDALPITEQTGLDYASKTSGLMHACGHDGHTTILLGAARALAAMRDKLPRPVKLLFQPAEEGGAGAKRMVDEGALTAKFGGVETAAVFGLHGWPDLPLGQLATKPGAMMASTNTIRLAVTSPGGHAALPHLTGDAVLAASTIVTRLQSIVSRSIDPTQPAVVSICSIHGGSAENILPNRVEMVGTIRATDEAVRRTIVSRVKQIAESVTRDFGCGLEATITDDYPVTINDAQCFEQAARVAREQLGEANVLTMPNPIMGAEDFAYYGRHVPACFSFVGLRPSDADSYPGLHTSRFDFNDDVIAIGVSLMCGWAMSDDS
jgi:hippurate hydrolase